MPQLTKKDFQQILDSRLKPLATKKDVAQIIDKRIDPISKRFDGLSKILQQTTALLTNVVEDVGELKTDMKAVKETVNSHTITLDKTLKNTEDMKTENAAMKSALDRHERWITQLADKVGIELEE